MENDESSELGYYDAVSGFALRFFRYCSRGVGRRESISAAQAFYPSAKIAFLLNHVHTQLFIR